ncbi:MAG: S1 RNA-binding domain-containing protein, partial [Sphingobacteriia bacterium]
SDPSEVLKLGQKVQVKVLEIDLVRKRIALSIKQTETAIPTNAVNTNSGRRSPSANFNASKRANDQPADLSNMNVNDALQALKKKFGK